MRSGRRQSILRNLLDDAPYGDPDFCPAFESATCYPEGFFELVFVLNDDGLSCDVVIPELDGIDPDLLAMCRTYASPN